jgi:hypothetical protein
MIWVDCLDIPGVEIGLAKLFHVPFSGALTFLLLDALVQGVSMTRRFLIEYSLLWAYLLAVEVQFN